jgi:hypothetical protein
MIDLKLNPRLCLHLDDLVPESIETLTFEIDAEEGDEVSILIQNRGKQEFLTKTADANGRVSIRLVATEDEEADIPTAWFNRWAGVFYFKFWIAEEPLSIDENYDGVALTFSNVGGWEEDYKIELTTGTVVVPPDEEGVFDTTFDQTFG